LAHTLPQVNLWTHGTLVTAMHGHLAFWGAYGMIVLAIISYSMPNMTGRKLYDSGKGLMAFWLSNIGMLGMTTAFAAAGVGQVYMERIMGMEFGDAQKEIQVHFLILVLCATLFTIGVSIFIAEFIRYGRPSDEALENSYKN
jgi:nitric oxide reductase subunit B